MTTNHRQQVLIPESSDVAYAAVPMKGGWGIGVCIRHQQGYRPVDSYGPYPEERATEIAAKFNKNLKHTPREAAIIIATTMRFTS